MTRFPSFPRAALIGAALAPAAAPAADFDTEVLPLLQKYCVECHGHETKKSGLNYELYQSADDFIEDPEILETTQFVLEEKEMPPKKAKLHPSPEEAEVLIEWVSATLHSIENAAPNDPGIVVMPRLNHREYNAVVRDLTGYELDLAALLTPDSPAGEGFLNMGQAQSMDVAQFEGFLAAAKALANHAIPLPTGGIQWLPAPTAVPTEPDKAIDAVIQVHAEELDRLLKPLYQNHAGRVRRESKGRVGVPYLEAAYRYQHRAALGKPDATFEEIARLGRDPLLPSSVERWVALLNWEKIPPQPNATKVEIDAGSDYMRTAIPRTAGVHEWVAQNIPLRRLAEAFHRIPAPKGGKEPANLRDQIEKAWAHIAPPPVKSDIKAKPPGNVAERNFRSGFVDTEYHYVDLSKVKGDTLYLFISPTFDGPENDFVIWQQGSVRIGGETRPWNEVFTDVTDADGKKIEWGTHPKGDSLAADAIGVQAPSILKLKVPAAAKEGVLECNVTLDPKHGRLASVHNHIDHRMVPNLERMESGRALGMFTSKPAFVVNSTISILADAIKSMEYRAFGDLSDEEEDWVKEPTKLGWQLEFLSEEQARALDLPWPLPKNMPFHATWPQQFNSPRDFLPIMGNGQKEKLGQLEGMVVSMAMPERVALRDAIAAAGFPQAGWTVPTDEQLARFPAPHQSKVRQLVAAYRERLKAEREQAAADLRTFVTRAWRGISPDDSQLEALLAFYDQERAAGAPYVPAFRAAMVPALVHPRFIYRTAVTQPGEVTPMDPNALASRISFMMWGSIPDDELVKAARDGKLDDPEVLAAQIERMLADPRSSALATEFAGFWLQFADAKDAISPDPERFKGTGAQLAEDFYRESVLFFQDLFQNNRPVTDALFGNHTFLNDRLAKHYGVKGVTGPEFRRVEIEDGRRGGILGMGSFLAKYSSPLRTSPVRRGAWLYETVLGIHMPPPPDDVPQLSDDETNAEGLSVRVQLEQHRENPSCFSCHDRIDPLGIALENFNPVGQWREKYLSGDAVDNQGKFVSNGQTLDGVQGLREHLRGEQDRFVENFCEKLIGYALGRSVLVTDRPLVEAMVKSMEENENRPASALRILVNSRQFLYQRNFQP